MTAERYQLRTLIYSKLMKQTRMVRERGHLWANISVEYVSLVVVPLSLATHLSGVERTFAHCFPRKGMFHAFS